MNKYTYSDGNITITVKSEKEIPASIASDIIVRILNALPIQSRSIPQPGFPLPTSSPVTIAAIPCTTGVKYVSPTFLPSAVTFTSN